MKGKLKTFFSRDRKILYMILSIVLFSIFSLTIVYAALSVTLNIQGNAEVVASTWDIHLDNVKVTSGSVSGTTPSITTPTTASFSTTLNTPGDFYEFTIDVVNDGSIDAMIDNVTKTPTLTETQAKYLNYIIEYQNGESISTKQLVSKNSFVRLKVRVEFRKDISALDLPTTSETLNLSFTVNYVQSDGNSENVSIENNGKLIKVVSGDGTKTSDEVCIGKECFYVMSSDENSVTMLAKMNITTDTTPKQSSSAPTVAFSSSGYWGSVTENTYVYDSNSIIYNYVENYKAYLENQGVEIEDVRLIKMEELNALGCSDTSCKSAPSWVYRTSYWSGETLGGTSESVKLVNHMGNIVWTMCYNDAAFGVRPVIIISKFNF